MRTLIISAFLCLTSLIQAQKTHYNEFSLGYFTAGYFFDSTGLAFSDFDKGENINLQYSRFLNKHFSIGLNYVSFSHGYLKNPHPQFLQNNTVIGRYFTIVSVNAGYKVSKWSMTAQAKAGINYRYRGDKVVHYFYFGGGGPWVESVGERAGYKELGTHFGLTLSHPIFWKIFGEIECEYARMFPGAYNSHASTTLPLIRVRVDPNQLLLSYRVGIRF